MGVKVGIGAWSNIMQQGRHCHLKVLLGHTGRVRPPERWLHECDVDGRLGLKPHVIAKPVSSAVGMERSPSERKLERNGGARELEDARSLQQQ